MYSWVVGLVVIISTRLGISAYIIDIALEEKIVWGSTAKFKAEVFDESRSHASGNFRYYWKDNAIPQHEGYFESTKPVSYWNVTYNNSVYSPGQYLVEVDVQRQDFIYIWENIGRNAKYFNITTLLNGEIQLSQNKTIRRKLVSNASPVNHQVVLSKTDMEYLYHTKNSIKSYWFVDCVYYGVQNGLNFEFNYTQADVAHYVEVIVVGSTAPVIPTTTTTTTTPAPTTLKPNVTTTSTTVSITTTPAVNSTDTNEISQHSDVDQSFKDWLLNFNKSRKSSNSTSLKFCINPSSIPFNHNNTYGVFQTSFGVKAPIKVSPINGTNWLQDGEILNITIACNGSSPFLYCVQYKSGLYNVTGNETCSQDDEKKIKNCSFGVQHLFKDEQSEYTLVIIISNSVSRVAKPIAINIYKATKHAQLSVIIVPVTFSIVAIILIIFGVAYYLQSKRTYTIEVADFDFGNQTSDMEYKTFRERLRESVSNSFMKSQDLQDSEVVWSPSRKYGSMQ